MAPKQSHALIKTSAHQSCNVISSLCGQDGVASELQLFSLEAVCKDNPEVTSSRRHSHGTCDDKKGKNQEKQNKV